MGFESYSNALGLRNLGTDWTTKIQSWWTVPQRQRASAGDAQQRCCKAYGPKPNRRASYTWFSGVALISPQNTLWGLCIKTLVLAALSNAPSAIGRVLWALEQAPAFRKLLVPTQCPSSFPPPKHSIITWTTGQLKRGEQKEHLQSLSIETWWYYLENDKTIHLF